MKAPRAEVAIAPWWRGGWLMRAGFAESTPRKQKNPGARPGFLRQE